MLPKKILFCTDFSVNSIPAGQLAVDYAKAFGAELLIIHVIDATGFPSYVDWVGEELNQIMERTQNSAVARLEELAKEYRSLIPVKTYCTIGSSPKEIVDLAARESVDLIVIGTHGRTGVKHLVMGSVARSVLRSAHRPVLIVEAPMEKGESAGKPYEFPIP